MRVETTDINNIIGVDTLVDRRKKLALHFHKELHLINSENYSRSLTIRGAISAKVRRLPIVQPYKG